jgi:beta-phosphoglucomutase
VGSSTKIRAVIFDMDGVLIDAKEWHYEALNKALSLFGFSISRYDHLVTYNGLPTARKLEMLSLERGLPRRLHKFLGELKQQYTMQNVYNYCRPIFAQEYALSQLKQSNYRLAVCSNSVRSSVDAMLEKSALKPYLDFYLSNQDVEKPKPHPEIYLSAFERLGLTPSECLILEDSEHGVQAAKDSGAKVMIVGSVSEVNLENIYSHIRRYDEGKV